MSNPRTYSHSFNGGEVTPEFWGQISNQTYQTGLSLCRNFVVKPQGPLENRAGFAFVRMAKNAGKRACLIPFTFSTSQTFVIEFGDGYCRFHTRGATLESAAGVAYEVATPYQEADLFDLHYVQSADVLTIVHPNYPPAELRRTGALSWVLQTINFAAPLTAPTGVNATPSASGPTSYAYKVTALPPGQLIQQSLASAAASCSNDLFTSGRYNTITWSAVPGAGRYYVYKQSNGIFGYIGQTTGLLFTDDNIAANLAMTPPEAVNPFAAAGDYPGAVSYAEQRRWFAGTNNRPQTFWATRSGSESDMSYSLPTRDDDSLQFKVAAREANTVRHIVPMQSVMLLTSSAEWRVTSVNSDAITPSTVSIKPQSYVGANGAQPVLVNNSLIFAAARGGHMREMAYNWQAQGYITGDLSLKAPHLFDGLDVVQMAYAKAPLPVVWAVSTSGKLLGLTYVPEQQVGAWHQHDTKGGAFESCCAVAEGGEDALYVIVRRTLGGKVVRTVERMASRQFVDPADAFFVDCGGSYRGAPASTISGLTWLNGETVAILADGAVHATRTVVGGSVTLDVPASIVQIGLPIEADMQTLPLALQMPAFGQGRPKNVSRCWLRVYRSSGVWAGPTFERLRELKQRTSEPYSVAPWLRTAEVQIEVDPAIQDGGQACVSQRDPLPLTIASLTMEAAISG